jgi:hypothetical protein
MVVRLSALRTGRTLLSRNIIIFMFLVLIYGDHLCGLVVRVLGYRFGGPGSIPGTTRFSGGKKKKTSSGSGTGSTQPREYN